MFLQDTIRYYLHVVGVRWKTVVIGAALGGTVACSVSLVMPPVYQANVLVKINSVSAATTTNNDVFSAQAQGASYALLVTSPEVLQRVVQRQGKLTVDQLKKMVSASSIESTQLIEIRVQADQGQRAADLANQIATVFIQVEQTQESSRLQSAADALSPSLAQAKMNVATAQQDLQTLQNNHANSDQIARQQSQVDTYQASYTTLLTNYNQLLTQKLQSSNLLSLAQRAQTPQMPVSPLIWINTGVATGLSLVIMGIAVLVQDWMDDTIQTGEDIAQMTSLMALGSIPFSRQLSGLSGSLISYMGKARDIYDHFAILATSFKVARKKEQSLIITSPESGDGKSSVAASLALSLAQMGIRVLLVDAHIQKPKLHELFDVPNTHGLTFCQQDVFTLRRATGNALEAWLEQWQTSQTNLWLLPAGPQVEGVTMSTLQPSMQSLQEWLLKHIKDDFEPPFGLIDIILYDVPSMAVSNDCHVLAGLVDATLLVIEAGRVHKELLQRCQQTFQRLGAPVLGVILNRQRAKHRPYFYTVSTAPAPQVIIEREGPTVFRTLLTPYNENAKQVKKTTDKKETVKSKKQITGPSPVIEKREPTMPRESIPLWLEKELSSSDTLNSSPVNTQGLDENVGSSIESRNTSPQRALQASDIVKLMNNDELARPVTSNPERVVLPSVSPSPTSDIIGTKGAVPSNAVNLDAIQSRRKISPTPHTYPTSASSKEQRVVPPPPVARPSRSSKSNSEQNFQPPAAPPSLRPVPATPRIDYDVPGSYDILRRMNREEGNSWPDNTVSEAAWSGRDGVGREGVPDMGRSARNTHEFWQEDLPTHPYLRDAYTASLPAVPETNTGEARYYYDQSDQTGNVARGVTPETPWPASPTTSQETPEPTNMAALQEQRLRATIRHEKSMAQMRHEDQRRLFAPRLNLPHNSSTNNNREQEEE